MEELNIKGLVVKAVDFGDNDKLLTIVTEEKGKVSATVKGGKSLKSKFMSVSEPFTYASFGLRRTSKFFYLFDAELIDDFYPIREDLIKVSLASYICDIASELSLEGVEDEALLKLTLNALYALSYKDYSPDIVKGAYEFKSAVISGYMPEISACSVCGKEPSDDSFIDAAAGTLICSDCMTLPQEKTGIKTTSVVLPLTKTALSALRYLEEAPIQRFLSFRLNGDVKVFSNVCEKYLTCHLEKDFYTLSFYKTLK
jgi:DNA repair protein RecO (recombination protein O)